MQTSASLASIETSDGRIWSGDFPAHDGDYAPEPLIVGDDIDTNQLCHTNIIQGEGGRHIRKPQHERTDIGTIGIMNVNFGAEKSDIVLKKYNQLNLRTSPAIVIGLQEASPNIGTILSQASVPAVGDATLSSRGSGTEPPETLSSRDGGTEERKQPTKIEDRKQHQYHVAMGDEPNKGSGQGEGLMTAVRVSMASRIERVHWERTNDGLYKKDGGRTVAVSRVLVTRIHWHVPQARATTLVHMNVHFHYMTAKKATGMDAGNKRFLLMLSNLIKAHEVTVLSGDFNMSVFTIVSQLRTFGIAIDIAAIYPWTASADCHKIHTPLDLHSDSAAIFLIGGCEKITLCYSLQSFQQSSRVSGSLATRDSSVARYIQGPLFAKEQRMKQEALAAFPLGTQDGGQQQSKEEDAEMEEYTKGQGFTLKSYLPKGDDVVFLRHLSATFAKSTDIIENLTKDETYELLPTSKQKLLKRNLFDPKDVLFKSGAHMPIMIYLGNDTRRKPESNDRREVNKQNKKAEKKAAKARDKANRWQACWEKNGYPTQNRLFEPKVWGDGMVTPQDKDLAKTRLALGGLRPAPVVDHSSWQPKPRRDCTVVNAMTLDAPTGAKYSFDCNPSPDPPSNLPLTHVGGHIKWDTAHPGPWTVHPGGCAASSSDPIPRTPP